jgi:hypothetical protein
MLAPTISTSERVNALSLKAALLYTWLIPHYDDQGRLSGDASTVKALVVPLRKDISEDDVALALSDIEDVGLIKIYSAQESGGASAWTPSDKVIQVLNWSEFQSLKAPQPSKYPAPLGYHDKTSQSRDTQGRYA